ncbi:unnamed protein product [Staurois parvus]|uniref:Uncharacterized protein n=1 Tax=Staurois parvus TaxID=386267 RepID=A0ABN9EQQ0_9NEOB|nr:unnamed protein product [Staurois parvus]
MKVIAAKNGGISTGILFFFSNSFNSNSGNQQIIRGLWNCGRHSDTGGN